MLKTNQNLFQKKKSKIILISISSLIVLFLLTVFYLLIFAKETEYPPSLDIGGKNAFISKVEDIGLRFESKDIKEGDSILNSKENIYFYAEKDITGAEIIANIDPRIIKVDNNGNTNYGNLNKELQIQFAYYSTAENKYKLYPIGIYKNSEYAVELSKEEFKNYVVPAGKVFILFSNTDFGYYEGIKPISTTPSKNIIEIDNLGKGWHPIAVKNKLELKNIMNNCFNGISSIFAYKKTSTKSKFIKLSTDFNNSSLGTDNHFVWIKKYNSPGKCESLVENNETEDDTQQSETENQIEDETEDDTQQSETENQIEDETEDDTQQSETENQTEDETEDDTQDEVCYEDADGETICFPAENIGELFDNKSKVYTTAGISICNETRHLGGEASTFRMNDKTYYCDSNQMWNICSINNEFTISGDNERVCIESFSEAFGNVMQWQSCVNNNLNTIIDEAEKYCSVDGTWQDVADCEEQVTIDDELYCLQSENCSSEEDNGKTFDNNSKLCKSLTEIECNETYDTRYAQQISYDQSYYCDSDNSRWEICSAQTEFEVSNDHKRVCMGRNLPDGSTTIMEWKNCFFSKDIGKEIIEEAGVYCDVENKWEDLQNCENKTTKYGNLYCVSDDWINNCSSDTDLGKIFDNDSKLCLNLYVDECNEAYGQSYAKQIGYDQSYYCDSDNSRWEICSIDNEFEMSNDGKYICIKQEASWGEYMTWANCTSVITEENILNYCDTYSNQ